jgi:hypothetical protein
MSKMLNRLIRTLTIHASFVITSTALLLVSSIIDEQPNENALSVALVSIFVLIPWIFIIMVPITVPSAICSLLIYLVGGFFRERISLIAAILVGAAVMFVALSGSYPADMKFPFSTTWKIVFTALYVMCWIAAPSVLIKKSTLPES